ncbi:AraD1 family protein [Arundinibacter roseus]|uniref:GguC protein n=1 Tax=Arundinibacter roseus TaxID=2070510 RepID=A0A4R4KH33_9BACT|nr:AraD1 family protein [Arundinibacter roseus]TDB67308.1 GguC protein [Arundinibacter roseus]
MRLVQLTHPDYGRRVAVVEEPDLRVILTFDSIFSLAKSAIQQQQSLIQLIGDSLSSQTIRYEQVYIGQSEWQLLPAADHPQDARFCMLSGTGLTHKASAENRQKMHDTASQKELTDSMKMYLSGVEGGQPAAGQVGVQPEWFYKGNGRVLKAHNETLLVPNYGMDGGEEPELAAVYINDDQGVPCRIGFATANEFSDHVMEKMNYLYLAPSKIRTCSLGPELVLTADLPQFSGRVAVLRAGEIRWEKSIHTGKSHRTHSLENLEYHHFKYENHRIPWDMHIHFLGADAFSFGENISLIDGDEMLVSWEGMGRPLRNLIRYDQSQERPIEVKSLY